jgi:hypothetical protein
MIDNVMIDHDVTDGMLAKGVWQPALKSPPEAHSSKECKIPTTGHQKAGRSEVSKGWMYLVRDQEGCQIARSS